MASSGELPSPEPTSTEPPPESRSSTVPTLGPVERLAPHVPPDWWRNLFGPTYLLTDADVLSEAATAEEVTRTAEALHLAPTDRILDLCCGQGRHTLELARRGFSRVEGLDRSAFLVTKARQDAQREGLSVCFEEGDCRRLPHADARLDAVLILGNSFGYFEEAGEDLQTLREVHRVLRPGGRVLLDLADGSYVRTTFAPRSWEWIDDDHIVCRERELTEDGERLIAREVLLHRALGLLKDQFYAERLYDRAEIATLLQRAGFSDVRIEGSLAGHSERGQDLGLMEQRFLVAARRPTAPLTTSARGALPSTVAAGDGTLLDGTELELVRSATVDSRTRRRVAVLLGDPRRPDETKLGGRFDEDDFEVVERLKAALASLDGYAFTYLDDHATFRHDLSALESKADFVLNLCDEGLGNEPRCELHVPALLEAIGLPYTGTGPQGLATCYDKSLVRGAAQEMGVLIARGCLLLPGEAPPARLSVPYPVLVKPCQGDNSRGISQKSIAHSAADLERAVAAVRETVGSEQSLLIEEFLPGSDLTVSLLGNAWVGYRVLPITEDDYSALPPELPRLCGYEAKWLPDSPYWQDVRTIAATLPEKVAQTLRDDSRRLAEHLGCRDYVRLDWRLGLDGRPRLLEVNPNPGWCWDGHLAKQAALGGIDYAGLLRLILETAEARIYCDAP